MPFRKTNVTPSFAVPAPSRCRKLQYRFPRKVTAVATTVAIVMEVSGPSPSGPCSGMNTRLVTPMPIRPTIRNLAPSCRTCRNGGRCQRLAGVAVGWSGYCSMRLSGLVSSRRGQVTLDRCRGERGLERLVSGGGLPGCPHPLAVGPEAEDRADHDADIVSHEIGELAGLAQAVRSEAHHSPLDEQPDSVEREERDRLARNRGALPMPEAPVPVGDVTGDRGDDDGYGGPRQRSQVHREMQPAVDEVINDDAGAADDAELGALVDEQPETLIEPSHTAH